MVDKKAFLLMLVLAILAILLYADVSLSYPVVRIEDFNGVSWGPSGCHVFHSRDGKYGGGDIPVIYGLCQNGQALVIEWKGAITGIIWRQWAITPVD